jgi:hypothetical protein
MENLRAKCEELLEEENPFALFANGFDDAIIGITASAAPVVCYSIEKCIQILIERDGMDEDEAEEYFEYNVLGAYMGKYTPIFIR